jgi:hydroxymethylbilane synthase
LISVSLSNGTHAVKREKRINTSREIIVGTRGSNLARTQTLTVVAALQQAHPAVTFRVELVRTHGDRDTSRPLAEMGGEGLFTREIELALLDGTIDLAVHSLKDLPTTPADGLRLAPAVPRREDPRDVLVIRDDGKLAQLPPRARVGTSSVRRRAQLALLRPDLAFEDIRGNVETRLRKVREGLYDATVLARAGLARSGLLTASMEVLDFDRMLPAPGQGALGLEIRADDTQVADLTRLLDDPASRWAVTAERAFLKGLGGGCHAPIAALARETSPGQLQLTGLVIAIDARQVLRDELSGPLAEAERLGTELAARLMSAGAGRLLSKIVE